MMESNNNSVDDTDKITEFCKNNYDNNNKLEENKPTDIIIEKLSKRKQRRLKREQKWAETRAERRREEKKRRRERRQKDRQNNVLVQKPRLSLIPMSESKCQTKIIIDCDYESYMTENELKKLCKQLMFCYSINRHSLAPAQLWITSVNGKLFELMERYHYSYHNWDCNISDKHWTTIIFNNNKNEYENKSTIIYLTGDAEETIPDCNDINKNNSNFIFIIGGLIDHNRYKSLCLRRARNEFNITVGQLPIDNNIQLNQRKILSIPHVYEIILLASNGLINEFCWKNIFEKVIPQRKIQ